MTVWGVGLFCCYHQHDAAVVTHRSCVSHPPPQLRINCIQSDHLEWETQYTIPTVNKRRGGRFFHRRGTAVNQFPQFCTYKHVDAIQFDYIHSVCSVSICVQEKTVEDIRRSL